MSKKSYAKYNIERIMNWPTPMLDTCKNQEEYDSMYKRDKEYKFKELKHFFGLYFGLIKDGRKKNE